MVNNENLTCIHTTLDTLPSDGATGRSISTDADQDVMLNLHLYQDVDGIHEMLRVYQRWRVSEATRGQACAC